MAFIYYFTVFITIALSLLADRRVLSKENNEQSSLTIERNDSTAGSRKILVIILASYLIFVGGFRYFTGVDYGFYYNTVKTTFDTLSSHIGLFNEPGIHFVSAVGRLFYNNGIVVILLSEIITVVLYVRGIYKYSPLFSVSMILYLLMGEWTGTFNGIRQYLAAAIVFAGHRYIYDKKFFRYLLVVFIASLFHVTAWIMIIPYFFYNKKPGLKQVFFLAIGTAIITYSYDFIFNIIGSYKGVEMSISDNSYYNTSVNVLRIGVAIIPVIVFFAFCKKDNLTHDEGFYINGLLFNAFAMIAASGSTYLARVGIYTAPIALIGYGYLFKLFRNQRIVKVIILITFLLFLVYWWFLVKDLGYKWWFNRSQYDF